MLSIGKIAAGPKAAQYYTDQVARGLDDYYAGEGEEPGKWIGAGARSLGWSGDADDEGFAGLLAGAGLRPPPAEGAVAGFDLTFRAPKSVSVLWAVLPSNVAREIKAGHDAAVGQALGYLEREACRARRGAGGSLQVAGRGFVGAAFLHRASRAADPLLHTHVVVGNLTEGPDGRWTALDARHLYRHAKTAGFLYQAALRRGLTDRLGVEWEPVDNGVADVRGVPRAVIEHFSRRRAQILKHMAERGVRSAVAAQVSALETRRAKREVPIDRLRADWRARALEHGFDDQSIAAIFDSPAQVEPTGTVLDKLTEDVSAFGRPEVLQAVAQSRRAGATVDELERHVAAVLADSEIVRLASGPAPGGLTEPRFSTREMLATERALIEGAIAKRYSMTARVNEFVLGDVLRERSNLSDEQRRAVRELCGERGGVVVLRAAAGTGKTFALDAAREAWAHSGVEVVGCALSARAALELHDQSGIPAFTIAALRDRIQHGHELPRGAVLVVDEAGMVGTRALAALADAASRANAKLVLVGDDHQLPEIQAGGGFRALAERLGAVELREIRRQREAWDRAALDALRRGDIERWARAYRDRSRITIASRANDARAALVNDWYRADGDKLMIAARREDVRDLNDRARQLLKADGRLGPDELHAAGRGYAVGDRVVGRRNDRLLGILNGQRGTIEEIDREPMTIRVALDGGKTAIVDHRYLDAGHLDYGYAITAHRAQGATVDRAFVLGSDELYREWGYTALSRHRHEARFYVTRADLDLDRDAAPERDPIIRGIERLLGRSKAKELAIDGLADADALELSRERDALAGQFREDPPPHANRAVGEEVSQTAGSLDDARRRRSVLERDRDALPWYRRRERAELDPLLERNAIEIQWRSEAHTRARRAHDAATDAQIAWLDTHGSDAERLLAVDSELRARQRVNNEVDRRVDRFHAEPSPHNRDLPLPEIHHDLGHDLDIGL